MAEQESRRSVLPNGQMIDAQRKRKGWTIEDFADNSSLGMRTAQKAIAGRAISIETLKIIAKCLDTTYEALLAIPDEQGESVGAITSDSISKPDARSSSQPVAHKKSCAVFFYQQPDGSVKVQVVMEDSVSGPEPEKDPRIVAMCRAMKEFMFANNELKIIAIGGSITIAASLTAAQAKAADLKMIERVLSHTGILEFKPGQRDLFRVEDLTHLRDATQQLQTKLTGLLRFDDVSCLQQAVDLLRSSDVINRLDAMFVIWEEVFVGPSLDFPKGAIESSPMLSRSLYKDVLRDVPEDLDNDEQNRQRAGWHLPKGLGFFARAALRLERGIAKYQVRARYQGVNWDIVGGRQRWVDLVIRGKATTEAHRYMLLRGKPPVAAGVLASYGSMIPLAGLWHWINWVCKYILKGISQILGELELQLAYRYLV